MKRTINVLWTGGLDSSCRIAELSQYDIIVQPYYMLDKGRKSIKQELKAIKSISRIIRNNPKTRCELKDPIITDINNVKKNSVITNAWKYIHDKYSLGIQYDWLARFAEQYNIQLEIGLEKNPRGKAFHVIDNECVLVEQDMDGIIDYAIDSKRSNKEATILFQNLLMPKTIWHMTKLEEAERMKQLGLEDTISKTWFCHNPIFGMPCGNCNPCKDALNEDMAYRIPKMGLLLGTIRKDILECLRNLKKH